MHEFPMAMIFPSNRVRRTPFWDGVEAAKPLALTVYNRMLLPAAFGDPQDEAEHLKRAVQVWDVAAERQVQVRGPDAAALVQKITPRDLSGLGLDRCAYIPVTDARGGMINDPVALRVDEETWWISIADSDLRLWVDAIATMGRYDVEVTEPDVSPLAIQGPLAEELCARVFGDAVRDLRFFHVTRVAFAGHAHVIARSGYSKQGGFEVYVEGAHRGMPIWNALMEAGADLDVRAGGPSTVERVESGLLSWGNDMDAGTDPFEAGLGRFVHLDRVTDCIGHAALSAKKAFIDAHGLSRAIKPVAIAGPLPPSDRRWPVTLDGARVGQVTTAIWSRAMDTGVAIGTIDRPAWGRDVTVHTQDGPRAATVRETFWT
ncbi:MAG: dimethylsulfoniopropionate demethylase [Paracoccaceae bacterium]